MPTQIQIRRGTAAQWTSADTTLASGEIGFEYDTGLFKIGDGTTAWVSLGYASLPLGKHIPDAPNPGNTNRSIWTSGDDLNFNVPSGGSIKLKIAGTTYAYIDGTGLNGGSLMPLGTAIADKASAGAAVKNFWASGNDVTCNVPTGGYFNISANGVNQLQVDTTGVKANNIIGLTASGGVTIYSNTADGADNGLSGLTGGGPGSGLSITRGGQMWAAGNEHATLPGQTQIKAGGVAGAFLSLNDGSGVAQKLLYGQGTIFQKSISAVPVIKTTSYTAVLGTDLILLGNHATVPFTIILPAATGSGLILMFGNIGAATLTIDGNAAETINGTATFTLAQNTFQTIVDAAAGVWYKI